MHGPSWWPSGPWDLASLVDTEWPGTSKNADNQVIQNDVNFLGHGILVMMIFPKIYIGDSPLELLMK